MLAIRMQRTGRKGQAQFRMIVQDSRRSPSSGNIVELLGSFDPHTKVATINKDRVVFFLNNGAQPSDRVIRILSHQKIEIPSWVSKVIDKKSKTKNPDKLRKNQPVVEKQTEEVVAEPKVDEEAATETPLEEAIMDEKEEELSATEAEETETSVEPEKLETKEDIEAQKE
jgi:small subunit ribosomal protein S16